MRLRAAAVSVISLALAALPARADEGMWTFDNLPHKQLQAKFGFSADAQWLEHVRLSTLSLGGCTGSFVSADGLVLTNHHCTRGTIMRVSSKERDLVQDGFIAASRDQEIRLPGLTYRTLMQMENVTEAVAKAARPGASEKAAAEARGRALEGLKADLEKKTGLSVQVVSLYQGGETWLYAYKTFRDIRLVAAPELAMALFGGDWDNFTYPRHDLDFTLLRVYEDGKPYRPPHHLTLSRAGLKAGDLTFVVGHPGRTNRLYTTAQMAFDREVTLPWRVKNGLRTRAILEEYGARGADQARQARTGILGVNNSLKRDQAAIVGLNNTAAMAAIAKAERALQAAVAKDPALKASTGASWTRIEAALAKQRAFATEARHLGNLRSPTFGQAQAILRLAEQEALPAEKRLAEYQTPEQLKALRQRLAGAATGMMGQATPPEQELLLFTRALQDAQAELGAKHPFVAAILAGRSPEAAAKALLEGTGLRDGAARKALVEGGKAALAASADPMLAAARKVEPLLLALRKRQDEAKAVIDEHAARIAKARFQLHGKANSPDATGTLRLSYGAVEGLAAGGTQVQPFTTFLGLYDRHLGFGGNAARAFDGSWALPQRWLDRMDRLNLKTPFNFIHSVDTVGGNSGSPVVDRKGELVGLLFDGNFEGLAGNTYFYDGAVNRSVSVDVRAILEALDKVYDASHLVAELTAK